MRRLEVQDSLLNVIQPPHMQWSANYQITIVFLLRSAALLKVGLYAFNYQYKPMYLLKT